LRNPVKGTKRGLESSLVTSSTAAGANPKCLNGGEEAREPTQGCCSSKQTAAAAAVRKVLRQGSLPTHMHPASLVSAAGAPSPAHMRIIQRPLATLEKIFQNPTLTHALTCGSVSSLKRVRPSRQMPMTNRPTPMTCSGLDAHSTPCAHAYMRGGAGRVDVCVRGSAGHATKQQAETLIIQRLVTGAQLATPPQKKRAGGNSPTPTQTHQVFIRQLHLAFKHGVVLITRPLLLLASLCLPWAGTRPTN
jgi:hypothetical protein